MRRLVVLWLIVISGAFAVIAVGCRQKSGDSQTATVDDKGSIMYDLVSHKTYKDIMQCPLPRSASDIHAYVVFLTGRWIGYVVATVPQQDLGAIIEDLHLREDKNLLEVWSDALAWDTDTCPFSTKYWTLADVNDLSLYYYKDPVKEARLFLASASGRIYLKREIRYYVSETNEDGELVWKKKLRQKN